MLNGFGIKLVLLLQNPRRQAFFSIAGLDENDALGDDRSRIHFTVHNMDCAAGNCFMMFECLPLSMQPPETRKQ